MKPYKLFGVMLAACAVMIVWPLLVSAQKSGEPAQKGAAAGQEGKAQMKEPAEGPEQSTGKMEAYKKDLEKELRVLDKKIAALDKKMKKEGSNPHFALFHNGKSVFSFSCFNARTAEPPQLLSL